MHMRISSVKSVVVGVTVAQIVVVVVVSIDDILVMREYLSSIDMQRLSVMLNYQTL